MALLVTLALAASAAAPAQAVAPPRPAAPTFALTSVGAPGALLVKAAPGKVLHRAVRVRNVSARRIAVKLQAADIRNATNGNADFVTAGLARSGRWLHLSAARVVLAPRASRTINFTVRVPRGAPGGSSYAGIVGVDIAELTTAAAQTRGKDRSFAFKRVTRQALPVTIRLPGSRRRSLALRSLKIVVEPAGAGLVLGLRPGGSELIQRAPLKLRVLRDGRKVFRYSAALGQLFPGSGLGYRIPWVGRPTTGSYRVVGVIRPQRAAAIYIDQTIGFSDAKADELKRKTPTAVGANTAHVPWWLWPALGAALAVILGLVFLIWKLGRRRPQPVA